MSSLSLVCFIFNWRFSMACTGTASWTSLRTYVGTPPTGHNTYIWYQITNNCQYNSAGCNCTAPEPNIEPAVSPLEPGWYDEGNQRCPNPVMTNCSCNPMPRLDPGSCTWQRCIWAKNGTLWVKQISTVYSSCPTYAPGNTIVPCMCPYPNVDAGSYREGDQVTTMCGVNPSYVTFGT